ncbi:hypothetical protein EPA93_33070 [Ktedonosporobacter rubrisoli]|uniref:Uncharacterized protein n=1 Tax=Ktedonosporobacter rubrisoli TaxID=2509675 RepID=A0A4P6JXZ6_KTERU|nr:hypothetical protein [Ktedonosporobacter rubrisoli]QBD80544.1 hypothetical protein EPA93_33070 [Ktedonosporobacter rubrisoli]
MQALLTSADRLLNKLGPLNRLIDTLAQRIAPRLTADGRPCLYCHYYCTEQQCSHFYARFEHCHDQCNGGDMLYSAGCLC